MGENLGLTARKLPVKYNYMFFPLPHLEGLEFLLSYSDADIDWARDSK